MIVKFFTELPKTKYHDPWQIQEKMQHDFKYQSWRELNFQSRAAAFTLITTIFLV